MEIKEFTHYGIKVSKQSEGEKRFKDALKDNGIEYEVMPVDIPHDGEVYIYTYKGQKKYAFVGGGYIYITTAIPDDMDWWGLAFDVDEQERGQEPLRMHTQFQRRLIAAETKIQSDNGVNECDFFENSGKSPDEIIPEYWNKVAWELKKYYSKAEMKEYGYAAWDVDNKWVDLVTQALPGYIQ